MLCNSGVVVSLYLVKYMQSYSLAVPFGIALVYAFTAYFVYDQYEAEIDAFWLLLFCCMVELKNFLWRHLPIPSSLQNDNVLHQPKVPARVVGSCSGYGRV
ncbi:hypothetical protein V6N11_055180 [Hibiscus sabdariffa]|uniref:Uncharacterized protein n=1 Tax=Hibiscus sabdariffa TaxID=183260 RepID=A0ABR1ZCV0_9ROSI